MIVACIESGWEIIFQPSHGLLAGQLADELGHELRTRNWFATRAAIAQHDDEQPDFTGGGSSYLTDLGAPKNFALVDMNAKERFQKNARVIKQAYRKSRWMGLLESMHMEFLYNGEDVSKNLADLLEEERTNRRKVGRQISVTKTELEHAYQTMRWCDRCSLILCQGRLPAMERRVEIITTSDDTRYEIWQRDNETVCIDPWPFAEKEFEVGVEVYTLEKLAFDDDRQLGKMLDDAKPDYRNWSFKA